MEYLSRKKPNKRKKRRAGKGLVSLLTVMFVLCSSGILIMPVIGSEPDPAVQEVAAEAVQPAAEPLVAETVSQEPAAAEPLAAEPVVAEPVAEEPVGNDIPDAGYDVQGEVLPETAYEAAGDPAAAAADDAAAASDDSAEGTGTDSAAGGNGTDGNADIPVDPGDAGAADAATADGENGSEENTDEAEDADDDDEEEEIFVSAASPLVYAGAGYTVKVFFDESAEIPEGAVLTAEPVSENHADYEEYKDRALSVVDGQTAEGTETQLLGLYDVTIHDAEGYVIEPKTPVKVTAEIAGSPESGVEDVYAVHFVDSSANDEGEVRAAGDNGETEIVGTTPAAEAQIEVINAGNEGGEMVFETNAFSVFAIVASTTIEKTVLARDGNNYIVTVTYGPEAEIPEGADLSVEEITEDADIYDAYVTNTENVLGWEEGSAGYIRLFDIKIVDRNDHNVKYQPAEGSVIDVRIELADAVNGKDLNVVHFAEDETAAVDGPEWLASTTEGDAVSFQTDSFSVYAIATVDPGELGGKTYGIINTVGGTKPAGTAMMTTAQSSNTKLQGKSTTVRVNTVNRTDYVYVANNSNITMWTFLEAANGKYYITAKVGNASKYLKLSSSGLSLVDNPDEDCVFTVTPGTGTNAGKYKFSTGNGVLRLNGSSFERAATNYNSANAWMNFAELSDLNEDDFVTYTAQKVSISEAAEEVNNGDLVIVYTRIWNGTTHQYDYYAVDYDGKLVKAYESGDTISWVGSQVNTMLWNFEEHYYEGTGTPNGYYDLKNAYSGKYVAPKTSNGSETFLSDSAVGINLTGRENGNYYTTILSWDDYYYASLKVDEENVGLLSSTMSQASDFYFAKMSTDMATMPVTTVSTVDHTPYGITLKMQNFGNTGNLSNGRCPEMDGVLGNTAYNQWNGTKNLVGQYIPEGSDYPVATTSNKSLGTLFNNPMEVNHQFLTTTYQETGYFEYDSTRNFAHLITSEDDPWFGLESPDGGTYGVGDFVIYGQLGTSAETNKDTLRHGQFFPYNDIISGFQTDEAGNVILDEDGNPIPITIKVSTQYANTMDIHADPLSSLDPAYGEKLYEIRFDKSTHRIPYVDHFFGMEMTASFMQNAEGVDDWGHDLIFEFSGDDDFWLYVDDVLVLDLGGIHSALDGSVNFRTGRIVENKKEYWLKDRFEAAYRAQHAGEADLEENLRNWLKGIFKVETTIVDGQEQEVITNVFKDYSSHTMRMFYLERGAGASNIHMRFNISEYKEGRVQLEKKVSGTEKSDEVFPFQIWYKRPGSEQMERADGDSISVKDTQTEMQVPYQSEYAVRVGDSVLTYNDVFFLKAGQTVDIGLPDERTVYYIKECAMDSPDTYDWVKINGVLTDGSTVAPQKYNDASEYTDIPETGRLDFNTEEARVSDRKKVIYENHLNDSAKKNLTITKRLWQDDEMETEIFSGMGPDADNTEFQFRVYIGMEDGKYTLYKNGPYRVKNPAGEYCYYYQGDFVSTGKTVFSEITDDIVNYNPEILLGDTLQQRCTFHTGRGSISKIKAGYTVEIPDLMNGTPFIVVERDGIAPYGEIPYGYNRLGYEVNDSHSVVPGELLTETTEDAETSLLMPGVINEDQKITVHNQHGYNLTVNKVWSDAAFMEDHDEIYFAVYQKDGDAFSLILDSVRQLGRKGTSINWFLPELAEEKTLNDYEIYEVMLQVPDGSSLGTVMVDSAGRVTGYTIITGDSETEQAITEDTIIRIQEGGILTAGGTSNEHGYSASMEYVASYSREVLEPREDGKYPNTRTDTVTNSRPGIKIVKTDMDGRFLEGAVFTLSNNNETDPAKTKTFLSDKNGLVVVAYLLPDTVYTLKENAAPFGYQALIDQMTIKVDAEGLLYVNDSTGDSEDGYYTVRQVPEPTAANMPTVTIKNKNITMKAVKLDAYSGNPMEGVKFALYAEQYASTGGLPDPNRPMPDYIPMEGYENLVTDPNGIIPKIVLKNADHPDGLEAGHYYLREIETPPGYIALGFDIRINISDTGEVTIQKATRPTTSGQDWTISPVSSDVVAVEWKDDNSLQITVKNTPKDPVRIKKLDADTKKALGGVKFELYKSSQVDGGMPMDGEVPVLSGTTDENGILSLGGLEGLYFLFETETQPGYYLLAGPILINTSAENNTISASLNGASLQCKKVKDSNRKDVWEITAYNTTGQELPMTGGPGTKALVFFGGMLALFAVILLWRRQHRYYDC